jgi:hypothetical protein
MGARPWLMLVMSGHPDRGAATREIDAMDIRFAMVEI